MTKIIHGGGRATVPPATPRLPRIRPKRPRGPARRPVARTGTPLLFLAPGLALVVAFVVLPVLHTLYLSFFHWDGVTPGSWAGLANYRAILDDPELRALFTHSLVLIVFYAAIPIAAGLLLTSLLGRTRVRGMTAYRVVLFLPQAVSLVVVAVAWQWMYAQDGVVNQLLSLAGAHSRTAWLGSFTWALPAIGLIGSWLLSGLCMVLFLAGVQRIDPALYDAARVDGAGAWQEFRHVTLPGLRPELAVALTLTVVAALRSFDVVYVLTKGGPGTATSVPGLAIFQRAFTNGQVGSAAALAVVLTVLIFMVTALITRISGEGR
ncbi:carbohydrate ABC transporter permease [Actinomadura roseirufa]|uniref:carbohydrate ABC transporter permease n=1 Tax=Actinomadura roseirufa TaxID=2094049 RepID=UPI001041029E|nr:sugar ABC transporter permease [Actinomadura roseirufa]